MVRPNYLAELFRAYKKNGKMNSTDIARKIGVSASYVRQKLNANPESWNIGDLIRYCSVLNIPLSEAFDCIYKSIF